MLRVLGNELVVAVVFVVVAAATAVRAVVPRARMVEMRMVNAPIVDGCSSEARLEIDGFGGK